MIALWLAAAASGACTVETAEPDRVTWKATVTNGWSLVEKGGIRTEASLEDGVIYELTGSQGRRRSLAWVQEDGTLKLAGGLIFPWRAGPFGGATVQARQGLTLRTYTVTECTTAEAMVGVAHVVARVRRGVPSEF